MAPSLAAELLAQEVDDNNVEYMARIYELFCEFDNLSQDPSYSLFQATSQSLADLVYLLTTTANACSDAGRRLDLQEALKLLQVFPLTVLRDPRNPRYGRLFAHFIESTDSISAPSTTTVNHAFWNSLTYMVITGRHREAYESLSGLDSCNEYHFQYLRYILAQYPLDQGLPAFYAWRTLVVAWERVLSLEIKLAKLRASGKAVKETIFHEPFDMFETPAEDILSYAYELAKLLESTIKAYGGTSDGYSSSNGISKSINASNGSKANKNANANVSNGDGAADSANTSNNINAANSATSTKASDTSFNSADDSDYTAMHAIAQIMLGLDTVAPSWCAKFSLLFYYTEPRESAIPSHFASAIADYSDAEFSTWELGAQALFDDSVVAALDHMRQLDIPVAALLAEMCNARGVLDRYNQGKDTRGGQYVVDQLDLEFATQCLSNPNLVGQGLEILVNMRESSLAREWAQELLPQILLRDLAMTEVLAATATQMQLPELTASLLQKSANGFLEVQDYAGALQAYDQAGDYETIQNIVWELFADAIVSADSRLALQRLASGVPVNTSSSPYLKTAQVLSKVLVCLIDAVELNDTVSVTESIDALMQLPQPPLRFRPLIVALVCGGSKSLLSHKYVKIFLDVLDSFEKQAADVPIEVSDQRVMQALLQLPQSDLNAKSIIWLLKRQLMKELRC